MKTFKDLIFNQHPNSPYLGEQARIDFENGYGISVVNGRGAYCDNETWEVAVMFHGEICYNTDITDDVLTYQSEEQITKVMEQLQNI